MIHVHVHVCACVLNSCVMVCLHYDCKSPEIESESFLPRYKLKEFVITEDSSSSSNSPASKRARILSHKNIKKHGKRYFTE